MNTVTKIVWKEKPSFFTCSGEAPTEETIVTIGAGAVSFKKTGKMNNYMYGECPFSEAKESWEVKIKDPDYAKSFKELSAIAEDIINNNVEMENVCDSPEQTIAIHYVDGRREKVVRFGLIFKWAMLRDRLRRYLPDAMVDAAFGDIVDEAVIC